MADAKFKFFRLLGGLFKCPHAHPQEKLLALFCPVSQREIVKVCLLPLPSSLHMSQKNAMGAPVLVESQAWVSGCQRTGFQVPESYWWCLSAPCLIAPAWHVSLEHCCCWERNNVFHLTLFWDEVADPVETQQSEQIKLRSRSFYYLCQRPKEWL